MEWYIKKAVALHLSHFVLRARDSGDWDKETMTITEFKKLLANRIDTVDIERVKDDIRRFIPNQDKLQIWSPQYFHDLAAQLKIDPTDNLIIRSGYKILIS